MPQIVNKAREVIDNPGSSIEDFANLVETDQVLALKVLKIANSAYYRRMKEVSSVNEAAVVLGVKALEELITVSCASALLNKRLEGYKMTAESMWRHSIAVAYGSKLIAKMKRPQYTSDAFTAGLIHDAGKLILNNYILERKEVFDEYMSNDRITYFEAEREILGFDHAVLAERICTTWNIPKHITMAIKNHHTPSRLRSNELAHIVRASDSLSGWIGMDIDGLIVEINDDSIERMGIQSGELDSILDEVLEYSNTIMDIIKA
jgi:HD-like signal output (HDOD) protein